MKAWLSKDDGNALQDKESHRIQHQHLIQEKTVMLTMCDSWSEKVMDAKLRHILLIMKAKLNVMLSSISEPIWWGILLVENILQDSNETVNTPAQDLVGINQWKQKSLNYGLSYLAQERMTGRHWDLEQFNFDEKSSYLLPVCQPLMMLFIENTS
ncbi:hypothetical protein MG293_018098 [Ovis ammon polii]|uniref:Uncharacterized protein n=1 Tax=Ovis ammon polii TaxID=230172 RepID=A0AAD4TSI1_OVIAM|nr:hypothetical protein MG293_018098 [Ovis ammon polii]